MSDQDPTKKEIKSFLSDFLKQLKDLKEIHVLLNVNDNGDVLVRLKPTK